MLLDQVLTEIVPGTTIPKPQARAPFKIKGEGIRRGKRALVYYIPNQKKEGGKPYQKGVNASELEDAYRQLRNSGEFTRDWFENNLEACASEGGCNFTTIGGLFELLGEAKYDGRGVYKRRIS